MKDKCPKCGETENLHYNYDYSKQHRPVKDVLCNECGTLIATTFDPARPIGEILDEMVKQNQEMGLYDNDFPTKPGFVERRMALGKRLNDKEWDRIYESYTGVSDLHDFIDWLKENYIAPERI